MDLKHLREKETSSQTHLPNIFQMAHAKTHKRESEKAFRVYSLRQYTLV